MGNKGAQLEAAMEHRRVELRMSWRDVSAAAEMSYEGLRGIRKGERNPNPITRARIEEALHWAPGSVDDVLAGREPTPAQSTKGPGPIRDEIEDALDLMRAAIAELERIKEDRRTG